MKTSLWFGILSITVTLVLSFGCASKKKQEENVGEGGANVTSTPIEMDSIGSDSGKIAGLSTVYFDYDKATLTPETLKTLKANAAWMKTNANVNLQIEGHCDARGSIEYNLALGERRAKAVRAELIKLGIKADRLSIVSYGKERPLVMGDTEKAYAKNRRANFVPLK